MAAEEEEYGGDVPELDDEDGAEGLDGGDESLEDMKKKLAEMEEEAAKLRDLQAKVEKEMGTGGPAAAGAGAGAGAKPDQAEREEADARSVYVGNVDYAATPEELQVHFAECGTVNRVTIQTDRQGNSKGFAYLEFLESEAVESAVLLNESELRNRKLKVMPKRTNVQGFHRGGPGGRGGRGRGRGRFGLPYGMVMVPMPMWGGRGRGRGRGGRGGRGRGPPGPGGGGASEDGGNGAGGGFAPY